MGEYPAQLVGQSLEGRVTEHILRIFYGPAANGKITFTTAECAALGDYVWADRRLAVSNGCVHSARRNDCDPVTTLGVRRCR
jgi:hypothetical protein